MCVCVCACMHHVGKKGTPLAEVWALASVFKKTATELKHKERQKLLKCKSTIQIVAFNIRTLKRIGQLPDLTAAVIDHDIDIINRPEHRYHHCEVDIKYHDTGNGWMFVWASTWKNSVNTLIWCVGMLIGPCTLKSLNSIKKIKLRMMVATFNGNPSTTIISCHSPNNASDKMDLNTF